MPPKVDLKKLTARTEHTTDVCCDGAACADKLVGFETRKFTTPEFIDFLTLYNAVLPDSCTHHATSEHAQPRYMTC